VGTHGYPCLSSPRSTCRRSGRDEVMSKRSKGMAPLRLRRVHRDPKKKTPPMRVRSRTLSFWSVGPRGRSEDEVPILKNRLPDLDQVTQRSFRDGLLLKWMTTEPSGGLLTYTQRHQSRREVCRPTTGDDRDTGRSVDLQKARREPPGGP
jgi:hypothetical protein